MVRSFYTAVNGMLTQAAKQDVISNNLANIDTVGFKGDGLYSRSFNDVYIQDYAKVVNGIPQKTLLGTLSLGQQVDETSTDFTGGEISSTGKSTDFAIEGRGFFTVYRDGVGGKNYYTRDGHFHVNIDGYLVDDSGDYVMGKNVNTGSDERIKVGNGKITSDSYGNISIDGAAAYKLDLVDFNDYNSLKKVGDNLYDGQNPIQGAQIVVQNQCLEKSNVNPLTAITNMMATMRNFESDQKVVKSIDETVGKTVNDVGKVG
ncbi:flagellar hook-basal body complex protein [Clostridium neuense]|uniref:Flagellar hook-basal body complex protein n=1 Tax=Clostridium neuense TaxID=1728934 RepID=A0ABW8TGG1_9CLOT